MWSTVGKSARRRYHGVHAAIREKDRVTGGLGELFDAGSDVDGVADQSELQLAAAADGAGDHRTGIDPDADPELVAESLGYEVVNQNGSGDGGIRVIR